MLSLGGEILQPALLLAFVSMADNANAKAAPRITENRNAFVAECAMKYQ
jgi:hypothetical protein